MAMQMKDILDEMLAIGVEVFPKKNPNSTTSKKEAKRARVTP